MGPIVEYKTIFISHSSKDTQLINLFMSVFSQRPIQPYFASRVIEGKSPVDKISDAIANSCGIFFFITQNVVNSEYTRDWINFEAGNAKAIGKPIFCWIDNQVKNYPVLLEDLTDYNKFNCQDHEDCRRVIEEVLKLSLNLSQTYKRQTADLTSDRISLEEAEEITKKFLSNKVPEYQNVIINSSEFKDSSWRLECKLVDSKTALITYPQEWHVEIKGKEIVAANKRTSRYLY